MPSWLHASTPAAISLAPFNPPLGPYPEMARAEPTVLAIKEGVMSLSGDDFSIKDQSGHTVVKCKGKAMSMRDRKGESILVASSWRLRAHNVNNAIPVPLSPCITAVIHPFRAALTATPVGAQMGSERKSSLFFLAPWPPQCFAHTRSARAR